MKDTLMSFVLLFRSFLPQQVEEKPYYVHVYRYQDPFTLESYPVIESYLYITRRKYSLSVSYWGNLAYNSLTLDVSTNKWCFSLNPISPDEYSPLFFLTYTRILEKDKK